MCRQSDAIAGLRQAADCLSAACAARIGTDAALQAAYRDTIEEPVPAEMLATLAKLGGKPS